MDAQDISYRASRLELDDADLAGHQAEVEYRIQEALWAHSDLQLARRAFIDACAKLPAGNEQDAQDAMDARVAFHRAKKAYDEACARLVPFRDEVVQVAA